MQDTPFSINLRAFNRKERFYLVGAALGNPEFNLSVDFVHQIQESIQSDEIDFLKCRFVAMDYHLDWIYASLFMTAEGLSPNDSETLQQTWDRDENRLLISATQEDIDLIAVFADKNKPAHNHLILLEAKGVGSWDTRQLESKGKRLEAILGDGHLLNSAKVIPHFIYAAPKPPSARNLQDLPSLMQAEKSSQFLHLSLPDLLIKVTQCDDKGKPSKGGSNWKIDRIKCTNP